MKSRTETKMDEKVYCIFCQISSIAFYDGKTKYGGWAYMCQYHYQENGIGLGLGKGQKLIYKEN